MPKRHSIVDFEGKLLKETALAYLLEIGGVQAWCPKSETEDNHDGSFSMPEWLAIEKCFV